MVQTFALSSIEFANKQLGIRETPLNAHRLRTPSTLDVSRRFDGYASADKWVLQLLLPLMHNCSVDLPNRKQMMMTLTSRHRGLSYQGSKVGRHDARICRTP